MDRVDSNLISEIVRRIDLLLVADDPRPRSLRAPPLDGVLSDIPIAMDILVYRPDTDDIVKGWVSKVGSDLRDEDMLSQVAALRARQT